MLVTKHHLLILSFDLGQKWFLVLACVPVDSLVSLSQIIIVNIFTEHGLLLVGSQRRKVRGHALRRVELHALGQTLVAGDINIRILNFYRAGRLLVARERHLEGLRLS